MLRRFPAIFLLTLIVLGIVAADLSRLPAWVFLVGAVPLALAGLWQTFAGRVAAAASMFGVALICLSATYFALRTYDFGPRHLNQLLLQSERYRVVGTIADWPHLEPGRTELTIDVDSIGIETMTPAFGGILLRIPDTSLAFQRGDRIVFTSRLDPPPGGAIGGFDYARYLRLHGIHAIAYANIGRDIQVGQGGGPRLLGFVDSIREDILTVFRASLDPNTAAMAAGFLIGETRDIPPDVYRWFRRSGTLHLLAVSGSNVALVLAFVLVLLRSFTVSRRTRAIILLAAIVVFALLSYAEPSVVRASVMAGLVIIATQLNRRTDLNNIIALAAAVILLAAPGQFFDVGFQLSFVTAWGMILVLPRIYKPIWNRLRWNWLRIVVFSAVVTVVAQLFSIPLIALYFKEVPLLAWPANLIIVPVVSLAVLAVLVLLTAAAIMPELATIVGVPVDVILHAVLHLLGMFGSDRMPTLETGWVTTPIVLVYYGLLVIGVGAITNRRARRLVILGTAVVLAGLLSFASVRTFTGQPGLEVFARRISGGIFVLISDPQTDQSDLIITGFSSPSVPSIDHPIDRTLYSLGVSDLRCLVLLAADYDAVPGLLRAADRFGTDSVIISAKLSATVADVAAESFNGQLPLPVCSNNLLPQPKPSSGLTIGEEMVRLTTDQVDLIIARNADLTRHLTFSPDRPGHVLISGGSLSSADLQRRCPRLDLDIVCCAKIEQAPTDTSALSCRRVDLRKVAGIRVILTPNSANPLKLVGLP